MKQEFVLNNKFYVWCLISQMMIKLWPLNLKKKQPEE